MSVENKAMTKGKALETIICAKIFLHQGKENAITIEELLKYGRLFNPRLSERRLRIIYSKKIDVCSCDEGIYWPITPEDMTAFRWYLTKKANSIRERYYRVAKAHPELLPSGQMDLFKEAR